MAETQVETTRLSLEFMAAEAAFNLDADALSPAERTQFDHLVRIIGLFCTVDSETGVPVTISADRISAIPAITARYQNLVHGARSELTYDEIERVWRENMPHSVNGRHPDLLFDIAQFNFGHDGPVVQVLRSISDAERRRRELNERYQTLIRSVFVPYGQQNPASDERIQSAIASFTDRVTRSESI